MTETLTVGDGRQLAYEVVGAPDGIPVFFQHGTGDSRLCKHPDDAVTVALGIRLVTADRPGVGGSEPLKHRSMHVELFVGDADDILDPEMSNRIAARLPDCTEHTWPGTGHCGVTAVGRSSSARSSNFRPDTRPGSPDIARVSSTPRPSLTRPDVREEGRGTNL